VTYLQLGEVARLLGVNDGTVRNWTLAGHVRTLPPLRGKGAYSLADCARLRGMTRQACLEAGLLKTPREAIDATRRIIEGYQEATRAVAFRDGDAWTQADDDQLAAAVLDGRWTDVQIADRIGRTFAATVDAIRRLREDGQLPPSGRSKARPARWAAVWALLTPDEKSTMEP
jgi:hypothetical protein